MIYKITLLISADSTNKLFKDKGFCLYFVFTADSSWLEWDLVVDRQSGLLSDQTI